ncbi:MAG: helix-turn-helix transcriptional regulator [Spirochaetes bacterium]|nr:helix-turn-helix transcriptional regulator [Spirochaetota bacterium]
MNKDIRETNMLGIGTRQFTRSSNDCRALMAAGIEHAGFGNPGKGYYSARTNPSVHHIAACYAGAGEVYCGGTWSPFIPGMVVCQPKAHAHAARSVNGKPFSFFWIFFTDDSRYAKSSMLQNPQRLTSDSIAAAGAVRELCWKGMGRQNVPIKIEHACVELITSWLDELLFDKGVSGRLEPLWRKVISQLDRDWDTESLAELAGVSPTHLRRICADETKASPMKKLTHLRMEHAKTLMTITDMKMDEVAYRTGYANMFAFSAAFKRYAGVSPSRWKELYNAETSEA